MPEPTKIFVFSEKTAPRDALSERSGEAQAKKAVLILDMGEASREEGFRLNGCR